MAQRTALRYAADRASAHRHSVSGPVTVRPFQRRAKFTAGAAGERARRGAKTAVEKARSRAGLAGFAPRDPATLSGGQRARVSLLRALLARPEALLLDEPFSRLDASLRAGFRRWVFEELDRQAIPAILVTHDREDCPPTGRCLAMERWQ